MLLIGVAAAGCAAPEDRTRGEDDGGRPVGFAVQTMGTYGNVTIVTADSAAAAPHAAAAHAAFQRVDSLMSNWTSTSEVARLNRTATDAPTPVQEEVATVLEAALSIGRDSDGAFDITVEPLVRAWGFLGGTPAVPSAAAVEAAFARVGSDKLTYDAAAGVLRFNVAGVKIDLGGIAKGYAVDRAAAVLRAQGIDNALVDISGNMMAMGAPPAADRWRIGIRDPRDRLPYFARLQLSDRAVATSGIYEQFVAADGKTYGHILDPRSGRPAAGLISVTVVASSAMEADAWGTALFVLGPEAAMRLVKERDDLAAILVESIEGGPDLVWIERELAEDCELTKNAIALFRVEYF